DAARPGEGARARARGRAEEDLRRRSTLKAALLALAAWCAIARAEAPKPWSQGVPEATQQRANALFAEGNQLFAQQAHGPALDKYHAAIALWDHPLIRFNMAVTLIRLDRVLEAADELDRALRYGAQPFTT